VRRCASSPLADPRCYRRLSPRSTSGRLSRLRPYQRGGAWHTPRLRFAGSAPSRIPRANTGRLTRTGRVLGDFVVTFTRCWSRIDDVLQRQPPEDTVAHGSMVFARFDHHVSTKMPLPCAIGFGHDHVLRHSHKRRVRSPDSAGFSALRQPLLAPESRLNYCNHVDSFRSGLDGRFEISPEAVPSVHAYRQLRICCFESASAGVAMM